MIQTEQTAIVLRYANYRDSDRMLTLFSPTKGRIEAVARGCRKSRSPLLSAAELFALGNYELYARGGRLTVIAQQPIESFYHLRQDYDRLICGVYLLKICQAVVQPGVADQTLFMLLLHTLSRLNFSNQEYKPLLAGFFLHFAVAEGFKPRLNHCVCCTQKLTESEQVYFDIQEGGLVCHACHQKGQASLSAAQVKWLRSMLNRPASEWVNRSDCYAPFTVLRRFVESRLDRKIDAELPD